MKPEDILRKKFKTAFTGGYKQQDVDDFMDEMAVEFQKLYQQNQKLSEKLDYYERYFGHKAPNCC